MKTKIIISMLVLQAFTLGPSDIRFVDVSATHIPPVTDNTMDIEMADLDGDGDEDMVLAMEFKPNIILLNDGKGTFNNVSSARLPQVIHDSEDIALADFDKDGDIDIVFVSEDDRVHEYYLNDGKGFFTDNSLKIPVLSTCNAVDAADFDHDGDIDLILGNDGQDFFLLNDGKGNFTDETQSRMPVDYTVTQDVQSADLDGDGDLDLVMGNENGNRMYLNDGKGRFTNNTEGRLPVANEETRKADLADIDGDGDIDIFFSNVDFGKQKDKSNRILINNGKGFFTDETSKRFKALNDMHTADIEFADMNGDNYPDMLIGNVFGGYIQVCINDGKGNFTEISDTAFTSRIRGEAISVQVADVNKDGKKDVYLGMFRSADMLLLGR